MRALLTELIKLADGMNNHIFRSSHLHLRDIITKQRFYTIEINILLVAWITANITIHLQPPGFLAASFSSCVVTLPSASCTEHCLSGHAWRCVCACLYLCMCAPPLPTSRDKGGPTRERLEVSVKTQTDTGRWRKRRETGKARRIGREE